MNTHRAASEMLAAIFILSALIIWSTPLPNPDWLAVVYLCIVMSYIFIPTIRIAREYKSRKRRSRLTNHDQPP